MSQTSLAPARSRPGRRAGEPVTDRGARRADRPGAPARVLTTGGHRGARASALDAGPGRLRRLATASTAPRAGSAAFALLCGGLLALGLLVLLLVNTTMSQRAFALHALQQTTGQLADSQDALRQQLAEERSPARLAERAQQMGLVPAPSVAFVRLSDGKVLGVAQPAVPRLGPTVITAPTTPHSAGATATRADGASGSLRESPTGQLPRTTSTSVSTKGRTTTTTTVTVVTDAPHGRVTETTRASAVTLVDGPGGTTMTEPELTRTVRVTQLTPQGRTVTTTVHAPDGTTSITTVTEPADGGASTVPLQPDEQAQPAQPAGNSR